MEQGMQVLILEDDPAFQAQLAQAMMAKGFNVLCVATVPAAEAFLRLDMADVLIFGERIDGRLTHPVALLAECRNPLVAAVLLTDRTGPDLDELFDLMPSLVGILGRRVAPPVVTQVVMAAVAGMATESARSRLASRWAAAEAEVADMPVTAAPATVQPQAMLSDALPMQADDLTDTVTADLADLAPVAAPVAPAAPVAVAPVAAAPVAPVVEDIPLAPVAPAVVASDLPSLPATLADVLSSNALAPISLADILAARPAAAAPVAVPVAFSRQATAPAAPVTPAVRPSRPSPDSPLARVLAAGHRAIARSQATAAAANPDAVADHATPAATRPATLPGWLTQPRATMSPAPLPAVVPATTIPRHLPARPTERRLHLA
jgi:hypothetical protein